MTSRLESKNRVLETDGSGRPRVDMDTLRELQEYYADQGWTDGLPVVPVTDSYLAEFLAQADRPPGDVVFRMNHLDRSCTVRSAAINAAMAGCRPEYFPVVLATDSSYQDAFSDDIAPQIRQSLAVRLVARSGTAARTGPALR